MGSHQFYRRARIAAAQQAQRVHNAAAGIVRRAHPVSSHPARAGVASPQARLRRHGARGPGAPRNYKRAQARRSLEACLKPTDITQPDYFHKVVDCQWACPAHTPVPEYIRLIAAGRYGDAYLVNWKSNVFPGHPGPHVRSTLRARLPARSRGRGRREEGQARARGDLPPEARGRGLQGRHPRVPSATGQDKNGKRIALVGAGPASLTVARDLAPLGYELVVFDWRCRRRAA